ncbi:cupin-like domain-containing protein [Anabaena sp. FACHB-1237]|uniref:cupin-like domain-containing protein n=1 Tax=Anabaena sp. FACHB-1237 TaxID=2692769 RepID=UPI00168090D6|nr:cupin-like domain-containing protein [Anabaena sp. FACHB-1237]MBD2136218.1 cupin-like domain-containing protein [Anabaena sp. FACHB-1237]
MAKCLEIKRVKDCNYSSLKQVTENFQKPIIYSLNQENKLRAEELKKIIVDFEENYKQSIFRTNNDLNNLNDVIQYSRGEDSRASKMYSTSLFFFTKDKILSPIGFRQERYNYQLENIIQFFFSTEFFQEKLVDYSLIQKLIIFLSLRKGIFGKFNLSNLSTIVNGNIWYSQGNTNTFIHADHGLCNFFIQLSGKKRWWIASHFQSKELLESVFQSDLTKLNLSDPSFDDLEYYDFEIQEGEIFYLPTNWLHGVVSPPGVNLSLSFLFPMTVKEIVQNLLYWKSMGVPLNHTKKSSLQEDKTLADLNVEQAEAFNQVKFYLRPHQFASRKVLENEPEFVSGLYDLAQLNKAITGAN